VRLGVGIRIRIWRWRNLGKSCGESGSAAEAPLYNEQEQEQELHDLQRDIVISIGILNVCTSQDKDTHGFRNIHVIYLASIFLALPGYEFPPGGYE
jgi:hypothetical protein